MPICRQEACVDCFNINPNVKRLILWLIGWDLHLSPCLSCMIQSWKGAVKIQSWVRWIISPCNTDYTKARGGPLSHYHTHESMIPQKWLRTFTESCIQSCGQVRKRKRSCGQWIPVLHSWMVASSLHVHYPEVTGSNVFDAGVAMLSWYYVP
jgi:hypothetical protein